MTTLHHAKRKDSDCKMNEIIKLKQVEEPTSGSKTGDLIADSIAYAVSVKLRPIISRMIREELKDRLEIDDDDGNPTSGEKVVIAK